MGLRERLERAWRSLVLGLRFSAVEMVAWEQRELENLFALLLVSPAAGIPGPPAGLSLDLLPWIERELLVLLARAREADDPMGELFSVFDVG